MGLAFALSVLLHGGLGLWVLRAPLAPFASRPAPQTIELEVVQRPPQRRVQPAPIASATPVTSARERSRHRRAHVAAIAPPMPNDALIPRQVTAPARSQKKPHLPDLSQAASASAARVDGVFAVPKGTGPLDNSPGIHAPDQIADPSARIRHFADEALGPGRVARGMVDPYFVKLGQALSKGWTLAPDHPTPGAKGALGYFTNDQTAQYGKTGSPFAAGDPGPGPLSVNAPGGSAQTSTEARQMLSSASDQTQYRELLRNRTDTLRVVIRLMQGRDGNLLAATVIETSTQPALDVDLVRQLRACKIRLPVPPAQGAAIHFPMVSVRAFELVAPAKNLPIEALAGNGLGLSLSGTFDLANRMLHPDVPDAAPVVVKRVTLLSVE